jgi:hypothetical protein
MGKRSKKDRKHKSADKAKDGSGPSSATTPVLVKKDYERELFKLQVELVKLQDWERRPALVS